MYIRMVGSSGVLAANHWVETDAADRASHPSLSSYAMGEAKIGRAGEGEREIGTGANRGRSASGDRGQMQITSVRAGHI